MAGESIPAAYDIVDHERELGFEETGKSSTDVNANPLKSIDTPSTPSRKQESGRKSKDSASPCLLKGDRVLAFTTEVSHWNYFKKRHVECKYVTGDVVLRKEWKDSNLSLYIRWQNGKFEKLRATSEHVAYTDRIFVLDRECLGPGSKVYLLGHPECEGTIVNKRYVVTGTDSEDSEIIFEDIDSSKLVRHSHGPAYVGNKILYHGWLGLTSDYRVRVYLKPVADPETEGGSFSIVLDSDKAKDFVFGQKITLGINLLRTAEFSGEFGSNWVLNLFRYYNTCAMITSIEIEELKVYWIGKAANPSGEPNPFDIQDAPEEIIYRDDLVNVQYLMGDSYPIMIPNSLWKYQPEADLRFESNNIITKAKWARKWQKRLDWDRWEYPKEDPIKDKERFFKGDRILKVMYSRSLFDVKWNNGNVNSMDANDLIPVHAGSVWSDMLRFQGGTIVKNLIKSEDGKNYGVIIEIVDDQTAIVKWINAKGDSKNPEVQEATVPLYDLDKKSKYDYLSKINQCPLVSSVSGAFKVGTVKYMDLTTGQVCVKLPNEDDIRLWPHEIVHFKSDIILCPVEGHWMSWYEHVIPPPGMTQVSPKPSNDGDGDESINDLDNSVMLDMVEEPKKKLECVDYAPSDNIFVAEDMLPRVRETHYRRTVDNEVEEMEHFLPDGMWVEYYTTRGDIMSAVILGPERTIFEDFLFVFDIFLLEDFPKSEPHVNFRSMGVTILPGHFCKSGAVFLPEETRLTEEDFTFSFILNVLLEIKDFMSIPLEIIYEKDNEKLIGGRQEGPKELFKFVLLSLLDYTIALLRKPPKNWNTLIQSHYSKALPRIIEKYKKGKLHMKRATASVKDEKGDVPTATSEKSDMVAIPWSETYTESIKARITELQKLHSDISNGAKRI